MKKGLALRVGHGVPAPNLCVAGGLLELLVWRKRIAACRPEDGPGIVVNFCYNNLFRTWLEIVLINFFCHKKPVGHYISSLNKRAYIIEIQSNPPNQTKTLKFMISRVNY